MNLFDVVSVDSLKQAQKRLIYDGKTDTERFGLNLLSCPKCISSVRGAAVFSELSLSFCRCVFLLWRFFGTFEMPVIYIIICNVLPVHIF